MFREENALSIRRRIEDKGGIVEGRRQVPGQRITVLRSSFVGQGADDEFERQRIVAELNPYLPVESFLTKGILFAGHAIDRGWSDIDSGCDFFDIRFIGSPFEEIDEGKLDAVFVLDVSEEFADGGGSGDRGVVVDELSPDGEVLAIVEKEPVFRIAGNLDAHAIGLGGEEIHFAGVLDDLAILEDIVVRNVTGDLKGFQAAKIGSHFVEGFHGVGIDCSGGVGLLCGFCKNRGSDGAAQEDSGYSCEDREPKGL